MKTAMGILKDQLINYRNESGNDSINIDLLIKGIDGIYSHNEKQQIIDAVTYGQNNHSVSISDDKDTAIGYYNETFGES